jgi:membrane protein
MIPQLRQKFDNLVWGDGIEKYGKPGHAAAVVLRYAYGLIRDMVSGQITLRAMSLVYTTLLSVVPLIAFSFSVLQGFDIHNQLEPFLYDFL